MTVSRVVNGESNVTADTRDKVNAAVDTFMWKSIVSALVVSFGEVAAALRVIHHAHALRPDLPVVVRASDEADMEKLAQAGAAEVVPEAFEASIMLASHALALIGVPLKRVVRRIREIRSQRYALMRGFFQGSSDIGEGGDANEARLRSVSVPPGAAVGIALPGFESAPAGRRPSVMPASWTSDSRKPA